MTHRKKITSQSGFMSVEAIATTLFYLIMIAIVAGISAQVMNSGKMAASLSAIGMLRVNAQYVGVNSGSTYVNIDGINLHDYVPLIATDGAITPTFTLPTSHEINIRVSTANDGDPDIPGTKLTATKVATNGYFTMDIADLNPNDCRKIAYYGIGGGYGVSDGASAIAAADVETKCSPSGGTLVKLSLTSK